MLEEDPYPYMNLDQEKYMYKIEAYKANSLLSQALSHNAKQLELKIKDLKAFCQDSETVATTSRQRSLALEDITRASSMAEKEAKSRMQEIETRLMNIEQKYIELERQMNQKVKALEDRELIYQEHVNDVAKRVALVRVKLAKNEPSADTNLKLQQESEACQIKINELQEQLNASAHTNMDMTERLMKNFAASRNQLLRNAEVDSKVQSSLRSLLSFVEDWNIKPTVLEMQPKISEEYANVAVAVAESDTAEFSRVGDKCSTFDTLEQQWLLIPSEHKVLSSILLPLLLFGGFFSTPNVPIDMFLL